MLCGKRCLFNPSVWHWPVRWSRLILLNCQQVQVAPASVRTVDMRTTNTSRSVRLRIVKSDGSVDCYKKFTFPMISVKVQASRAKSWENRTKIETLFRLHVLYLTRQEHQSLIIRQRKLTYLNGSLVSSLTYDSWFHILLHVIIQSWRFERTFSKHCAEWTW